MGLSLIPEGRAAVVTDLRIAVSMFDGKSDGLLKRNRIPHMETIRRNPPEGIVLYDQAVIRRREFSVPKIPATAEIVLRPSTSEAQSGVKNEDPWNRWLPRCG